MTKCSLSIIITSICRKNISCDRFRLALEHDHKMKILLIWVLWNYERDHVHNSVWHIHTSEKMVSWSVCYLSTLSIQSFRDTRSPSLTGSCRSSVSVMTSMCGRDRAGLRSYRWILLSYVINPTRTSDKASPSSLHETCKLDHKPSSLYSQCFQTCIEILLSKLWKSVCAYI